MGPNPFEPPREHADDGVDGARSAASGHKFYSPNQIAFAAFLGTSLASGWLMAENYKAVGNPRGARVSVGIGVVVVGVLFVVEYLFPEGRGSYLLALAYPFGIREAVRQLQGRDFDDHMERGGARHSSWRVVAIALVAMLVFFLIAWAIVLLEWGFRAPDHDLNVGNPFVE
jgi:hypothetical protein